MLISRGSQWRALEPTPAHGYQSSSPTSSLLFEAGASGQVSAWSPTHVVLNGGPCYLPAGTAPPQCAQSEIPIVGVDLSALSSWERGDGGVIWGDAYLA